MAAGDVQTGVGLHSVLPIPVPCAGNIVCAETVSGLLSASSNEGSAGLLNLQLQAENPFALLGSGKWAGRPSVRKDANPGPAKRARPVEAQSHRAVSKCDKKKGNKVPSGVVTSQGQFIFSAASDASQPCLTQTVKGAQTTYEDTQPTILEGNDHASVVDNLKDAISRQVQGSRDADCPMQNPEDSNLTTGHLPGNDMVEDQVGSLPPQSM